MLEAGIAPQSILALTFTNKAAREMKERYLSLSQGLLPGEEAGRLFAGTFHSFCVRVLRKHIQHLGYERNFTIYSESDQIDLVKEAMHDSGIVAGRKEVRAALSQLSRLKNNGVTLEQVNTAEQMGRVFMKYQEALILRNAVDFDDLLLLVLKLLREHEEVAGALKKQLTHLLVDEYQDTNALQFDIVRRLSADRGNLCVVGDDDQSIYSWRGAESRHILEFENHFPRAKVVTLEQNYRCTPRILEAANAVIRNNVKRHAKKLWSAGDLGSPIRVMEATDDVAEATWIATDILEARRQSHLRWEEVGILYRANHLSRTIEQQLRRMRIPYRVVGGQEFFERREVKDLLAYLQVILNPSDDNQLLRIINKPARGIGKASLEQVVKSSRAQQRSVWEEIQPTAPDYLSTRAAAAFDSFRTLISGLMPRFHSEGGWAEATRDLVRELDYDHELTRTSKDAAEAASRKENIQEFINAIEQFEKEKIENKGKNEGQDVMLQEFIDAMLLKDRDEKDKEKDKDENGYGVSLMTLHSAKGLEFDRVYIVGAEEGILPHDRVKLEGNLDEERRLFYVGLTRARKDLSLSYCGHRKRYGNEEPCHPSSFIEELPESALERISSLTEDKEVTHEQAVDRFAALKAKLAEKAGQ